jgi:hypothetical protein
MAQAPVAEQKTHDQVIDGHQREGAPRPKMAFHMPLEMAQSGIGYFLLNADYAGFPRI